MPRTWIPDHQPADGERTPRARAMEWGGLVLLVVVSVVLAWTGALPMVDHTTHRVLAMVDTIPWAEALRPFWNAEPMMLWAIRPLSVVVLKLYASLFGPLTVPPVALLRLKILLCSLAYGLAARSFLRAWGLRRFVNVAAVTCVVLVPNQFSMFLLPELDTLGAAATLAGGALLARPGRLGWRWVPTVAAVLFAFFLKESTGLVEFAFLLGGGLVAWRRGARAVVLRHALFFLAGGLAWSLLMLGTMLADTPDVGPVLPLLARLPIAEHNSAQFLSFIGLPGVAALVLGALSGPLRRRLGVSALGAAVVGAVALLSVLPPMVAHDHYATFFFSPRLLALSAGLLLWGCLAVTAGSDRGFGRLAAVTTAGTLVAFTLALLAASSPREDLASRLFLATAPLLHGMVWSALAVVWAQLGAVRWAQAGLGLLGLAVVWTPWANALNFNLEWRATHAVDASARHQLAAQDLEDSMVLFNQMARWVADVDLQAAGAPPEVATETWFVHVPDWLTAQELPVMDWGAGRMKLEDLWRQGVPVWVLWSAARPDEMSEAGRARLEGDFAWTRRPVGVFTPIIQSVDHPGQDSQGPLDLPEHNRLEDARMTRYRPGPTPLEELVAERGAEVWGARLRFWQVVPELGQVPWRLVAGVPLAERWIFSASVSRLEVPEPSR